MDYRQRKIVYGKKNLLTFIRLLADGKFLIPTFQRYFVWDPKHISSLWESIFLGYPIGSILYWRTPVRLQVHRRLGGFLMPPDDGGRKLRSYILDGQQRATALLVAFFGGRDRLRERSAFNYTLYFDLTRRDFFFEPELPRRRRDTLPEFLIRLRDVPDLPADFIRRLAAVPGYNREIAGNLRQLQYIFTDYDIPLIRLQGFDIRGVCDIFERVNQNGMKLENLDIHIARSFRNNPTIIEEDFPI